MSDTIQNMTPVADRERIVQFLATWLAKEPSTIALWRYPGPPSETAENSLGIFTSLGMTELLAVEQDGGIRDGHEYWYHGRGWSIHVRWFGLQWIFTHLRSRRDKQNVRRALENGALLFDKASVAPMLSTLAASGRIYEHLPAREVYRFRIELAAMLETLDALYAAAGQIEAVQLSQLFDVYRSLIRIAEEMAPRSEDQIHREIAVRLSRAGKGRVEFSGAVSTLRDLAELLLQRFGGKPRREYYTPANALQFMPPDPTGKPREDAETPFDESLCTSCGRRFFVPPRDGPPILSSDPASAPELLQVSARKPPAEPSDSQ